jgi:hypothetical protein
MEAADRVVTFEKQVATHGGLGGPQILPLIAWSPESPLQPETLNDPVDVYRHFARLYLEPSSDDGSDRETEADRGPN